MQTFAFPNSFITTNMNRFLSLFTTLLFTCGLIYAQDIIVKNDGSVINAYRTDYQGQFVYYQTEDSDDAPILRIKKEDVLSIRLADGTAITPNAAQPAPANDQQNEKSASVVVERDFPDVDLTDYHGFLLTKGNCVYVTYNTKVDYEIAAVEAIKQSIEEDGLWQVVDKPEQAHFVLQYCVSLVGRDFARLIFRPRENYLQIPYLAVDSWSGVDAKTLYFMCGGDYSSDEVDININVANSVTPRILQDYRLALESADFMESVKTGSIVRAKGNKEKWYVIDFVTIRHEAKAPQIKSLHDSFYRQ